MNAAAVATMMERAHNHAWRAPPDRPRVVGVFDDASLCPADYVDVINMAGLDELDVSADNPVVVYVPRGMQNTQENRACVLLKDMLDYWDTKQVRAAESTTRSGRSRQVESNERVGAREPVYNTAFDDADAALVKSGAVVHYQRPVVVAPTMASVIAQSGAAMEELRPRADRTLQRAARYPDRVFATVNGVPLRGHDLVTLAPGGWLNDEVINAYLSLVPTRRAAVLHSAAATKLMQGDADALRRWLRRAAVRLCDVDHLLIPANVDNAHWVLLDLDTTQCAVNVYDTLGGTHAALGRKACAFARAQATAEQCERLRRPWHVRYPDDAPRQSNDSDCGVYVVALAEEIAAGRDFDELGEFSADDARRDIALVLMGDLQLPAVA
jgi:hypothetical protein